MLLLEALSLYTFCYFIHLYVGGSSMFMTFFSTHFLSDCLNQNLALSQSLDSLFFLFSGPHPHSTPKIGSLVSKV